MDDELRTEFDFDDPALIAAFDELPLWSAPFGLALLDAIEYSKHHRALDVGCGAGFPLIELAQRLGGGSLVCGVDPWRGALQRARTKLAFAGVDHAIPIRGVAERLPFADASFDLLVSNNGFNNVGDAREAFTECFRVSMPKARLIFTFNLPDTMKEFYSLFRSALRELHLTDALPNVDAHIHAKRKPRDEVLSLTTAAGFETIHVREDSFSLRYADGSAMLRHSFIRLAFLPSWRSLIGGDADRVFAVMEKRLNDDAQRNGETKLTIPFACITCEKPA